MVFAGGSIDSNRRGDSVSAIIPFNGQEATLRRLATIVDMYGAATHISSFTHCACGLGLGTFRRLALPLLLLLQLGNSAQIAFSLSSWNSHGLLGSSSLYMDSNLRKKECAIRRLILSNTILCILEDHADILESTSFARKWSHSHVIFVSNALDRNCGGITIAILKSFVADCLLTFMVSIVAGRIIAVFIIFPSYALCIVGIHNSPTWTAPERIRYFALLRDCIPKASCVTTFIIGDLNFGDDTLRFHGQEPDSSIAPVHKSLSDLWHRYFGDCTEVSQDNPTFMRGNYLSLLDHVFTNLCPLILYDLSPVCSTVWTFGDALGDASDHVPIKLTIGAESGIRVQSIPTWVPSHPHFAQHCAKLIDTVCVLPGSPLDVLRRHKTIICEAAKMTLQSAHKAVGNLTIDQQIYWAMTLVRNRDCLASRLCKRALEAYPYISKYVEISSGFIDLNSLCELISTLQQNRCMKAIENGPRDDEDKTRFKERMNKLGQYLSLWASKRRKISNLAILSDDGTVSSSTEESASALSAYWSPKFEAQSVTIALARIAIKQHVIPCPTGVDPVISFETFCERIDCLIDSGTGVDTMVYSCWKYCHERSRAALYDVYIFCSSIDSVMLIFFFLALSLSRRARSLVTSMALARVRPKRLGLLILLMLTARLFPVWFPLFFPSFALHVLGLHSSVG